MGPSRLAQGMEAPLQGGKPHIPLPNPLLHAKGETRTVPRPGQLVSRPDGPPDRGDGRRLAALGANADAGAAEAGQDLPEAIPGDRGEGRKPWPAVEGFGGSAGARSDTQPEAQQEQQPGAGMGGPDAGTPAHDPQEDFDAIINKEYEEQWLRMKRMLRGRKLHLQKEMRAAIERRDQALVAFLCEMQRNMDEDYAQVEYDLALYTTKRLHIFG